MPLPSGTVTFLFTDIEGSTKLWEEHPDAMRSALARHDTLLRGAIEAHEGAVFKTVGDAFCAAFHTAPDALAAALAAQLALAQENWPDALALHVRMALHTGTAELRDNDYFGQPLNRVARLLAAGHGGQTLLSLPTEELTRDSLPPATSLLPLGEHSLRDLSRPETVFQLLHPALPTDFAPLRSLDYLPSNLPQQMTSFIGREKESTAVKTLLSKTRLLTIVGGGGCGKTRLSLQVAADVLPDYPDGTWFIELAPLDDPTLVPQTLAQVLSVSEEVGKPLVQTLTGALKAKKMLLVLDNCEHLLDACARLADTLLRACPYMKVLASSREGLGSAGEQTYRLPSLSLPDTKQTQTVESVTQYEAVRLFIERALAVQPQFAVTNHNAPALAQVCARLDGIPLAIELAAARVRSLSVEEINNKLDNRFRLLTGGSRTALPRQQTLRALIDWSYDLLSGQEKTLLCRLSVFAGGWTLEASEQVAAGESETGEGIEDWEVLDLLTSLGDKSLIVAESTGEKTRYRLLETVRQYARERMAESGETNASSLRHQNFFLILAEGIAPKLMGAEQIRWLDVLEEEHDNLRQALTFCEKAHTKEDGEAGLRLGVVLWWFWYIRGYYTEGRTWLSALLACPETQARTLARANALSAAAMLATGQDDNIAARRLYEQCLAINRELDNKRGIASALMCLGNMELDQGDCAQAQLYYEESLTLYRELGNKLGIANTLANLGNLALYQRDYTAARLLAEESLTLHRELGSKANITTSLLSLGSVVFEQGDYTQARALYAESLVISREIGHKANIANSLHNLGSVAYSQGAYTQAQALHEECLTLYREIGNKAGIVTPLNSLGNVAREQGDYTRARSHYAESLTLAREIGSKAVLAEIFSEFAFLAVRQQQEPQAACLWGAASSLWNGLDSTLRPADGERQEREMAAVRQALGEGAFALAWEEGCAMTMEQAIAYALEETGNE